MFATVPQVKCLIENEYFAFLEQMQERVQTDLGPVMLVEGYIPSLGNVVLVNTVEGKHAIIS